MTDIELRQRIRAAVKALAIEFKVPLQQEASGRSTTTVDSLLCVWRRLSEEERTEFLRRVMQPRRAGLYGDQF